MAGEKKQAENIGWFRTVMVLLGERKARSASPEGPTILAFRLLAMERSQSIPGPKILEIKRNPTSPWRMALRQDHCPCPRLNFSRHLSVSSLPAIVMPHGPLPSFMPLQMQNLQDRKALRSDRSQSKLYSTAGWELAKREGTLTMLWISSTNTVYLRKGVNSINQLPPKRKAALQSATVRAAQGTQSSGTTVLTSKGTNDGKFTPMAQSQERPTWVENYSTTMPSSVEWKPHRPLKPSQEMEFSRKSRFLQG